MLRTIYLNAISVLLQPVSPPRPAGPLQTRPRPPRRDFLAASLGAAAFTRFGLAQPKQKRLATDWVTLGKSNVKVTRLAFGTGTNGGRVQRELGQEQFTRMLRHAYDNGIRFFETADTYGGMHDMLGIALKGIPP